MLGPTGRQGDGDMFYVVEVGDTELFVELISAGVHKHSIEPVLQVSAGTDWEGSDIYITSDDEANAIAYVYQHHGDELYVDSNRNYL